MNKKFIFYVYPLIQSLPLSCSPLYQIMGGGWPQQLNFINFWIYCLLAGQPRRGSEESLWGKRKGEASVSLPLPPRLSWQIWQHHVFLPGRSVMLPATSRKTPAATFQEPAFSLHPLSLRWGEHLTIAPVWIHWPPSTAFSAPPSPN